MAESPKRCINCRHFHRDEGAERYAADHPDLAVHGTCRRYAPRDGERAGAAPIIRYPRADPTAVDYQQQVQELRQAAEVLLERYHLGQPVALSDDSWQIEFPGACARSPNDVCGEWVPREGMSEAGIFADWLEERGEASAAEKLRAIDFPGGRTAPEK